jgi:hypothetical protein
MLLQTMTSKDLTELMVFFANQNKPKQAVKQTPEEMMAVLDTLPGVKKNVS